MPITLVSTHLGSEKTEALFARFSAFLADGGASYVVPSEALAEGMRRRFLSTTAGQQRALLGNRIISLAQFVRLLASSPLPILTADQQLLLCFQILRTQDLKYFRADLISFAITQEAARLITLFKRNGITASLLRDMLATRGTLKEFDLLILFERYEKEKERLQVIDEGDLSLLAEQRLLTEGGALLSDTKGLVFDEFFPYEPGLRKLIAAIRAAIPKLPIIVAHPRPLPHQAFFHNELERSLHQLSLIADSQEELPASEDAALPTISTISLRSPMEEARAIAHQASESLGWMRSGICCRRHSAIGHRIEEELVRLGFDFTPRSHALAPLLHAILFDRFEAAAPRTATFSQYAELAQSLLRSLRKKTRWREALQQMSTQAAASSALRDEAFLGSLLQKAQANPALLGTSPLSADAFVAYVISVLDGETRRAAADRASPVTFIPFEEGAAEQVDRLFIPEMIEGSIPGAFEERLFFSNSLEFGAAPNELLDALFPDASQLLAHDAVRFSRILAASRAEVILSFAHQDDRGRETTPSSFLDEFGPPLPLEPETIIPRAAHSNIFWQELAFKKTIELERLTGKIAHPEFHGFITSPEARALIRRRFTKERFSPSRLETYAECPMRFFFGKVLNLEPSQEESYELLPNHRGTIIHAVLERFFREREHFLKTGDIPSAVARLVDQVFCEHEEIIAQSSEALTPLQKRNIATAVTTLIERELSEARELSGELVPLACEWTFGSDEASAYRIPVDGDDDLLLQGRVDRIDVSHDRSSFLIIDYKTGRSIESIRKKLEEGTHLQLPLYIEAVGKQLLPHASPIGGMLCAVMTAQKNVGMVKKTFNGTFFALPKQSAALVEDEKWDDLLLQTRENAVRFVRAIRDGAFGCESACDHCPFEAACRKPSA